MTHCTIQLPPDMYEFVETRIECGRYEDPGQLVQAAFRALHREENEFRNKPVTSTIAEGDVFRRLWEVSPELPVDRRKVPRLD